MIYTVIFHNISDILIGLTCLFRGPVDAVGGNVRIRPSTLSHADLSSFIEQTNEQTFEMLPSRAQ